MSNSRPLRIVGHNTAGPIYETPKDGEGVFVASDGSLHVTSMTDATNPTVLLKLAERCEQATGANRTLEQDIHDAIFGRDYTENAFQTDGSRIRPFTASLDAAMTLVSEGWRVRTAIESQQGPWSFSLAEHDGERDKHGVWADQHGLAATPALALCAAALRSRAAITKATGGQFPVSDSGESGD